MNPVTHGLLSWLVACGLPNSCKRDRALITVAGLAPDLDGFGLVTEFFTRNSAHPNLWWTNYHHALCHNLATCCVIVLLAIPFARRRGMVALLMFVTFHVHLLCDVVGAKGPDGEHWPIPYFAPFSDAVQWTWEHQWALNGWPNIVITVAAMAATFFLAWKRGYSPLEMVSLRADAAVVDTLRRRFSSQERWSRGE